MPNWFLKLIPSKFGFFKIIKAEKN
jgi:hypothetical protein